MELLFVLCRIGFEPMASMKCRDKIEVYDSILYMTHNEKLDSRFSVEKLRICFPSQRGSLGFTSS
jgi:hypothetical protein